MVKIPFTIPTYFLGTIKCNFNADFCGFKATATGDNDSKAGFKWVRKTAQQVTNQHLEGPGQGTNQRYYNI